MSRSDGSVKAGHVVAEVVPIGDAEGVVHDYVATFAIRQSPEDDVLAEATSGSFDVTVTVTIGYRKAAVVDVDGATRTFYFRFLAIKPGHVLLVSLESLRMTHSQDRACRRGLIC